MNDKDKEHLETLDHKLRLVRDRVRSVAGGFSNGMYLWGEGGTSKSYTIEQTLRELGKPFRLSNSRITGKGLFVLLRDYPDIIHLLEDVETLFADQLAFGVLRSALWGQQGRNGRQERRVVWQTAREREEFAFSGGLILVSNCPLEDLPQLRAIKTRIPCVHYQPSNDEIAALMRQIARRGHQHDNYWLSPEKCSMVAEEIISRLQRLERNLDLRLLVNTLNDYLQWANGELETHWMDMLESRLKERALPLGEVRGLRAQQKHNELDLVRRIAHLLPKDRLKEWVRVTGKSQAALYRRLKELGLSHFSPDEE